MKLPFKFTVPVPSTSRYVAYTLFWKVVVPYPAFTSANFTKSSPTVPITVCVPPLKVKIPLLSCEVVIVEVIFFPLKIINVELFVVVLFNIVLSTNTFSFIVVLEIVVESPIFKLFKKLVKLPILPLILLLPIVVIFPLPVVVVIFPEKFEFKRISPSWIKFKVPLPDDKDTLPPKITSSVVSISIEPAVTAPLKSTLPFSFIFPSSMFVEPETVFEPLKIKLAVYAVEFVVVKFCVGIPGASAI